MSSIYRISKYPITIKNKSALKVLTEKHNIIAINHLQTSTDINLGECCQRFLFITDSGSLIYSTVALSSDSGAITSATVDNSLCSKMPQNAPILSAVCCLVEKNNEDTNQIEMKLKIYLQIPKQKYDFLVVEANMNNFQDVFAQQQGSSSEVHYNGGPADRYGSYVSAPISYTPILNDVEVKFSTISLPHILGDGDSKQNLQILHNLYYDNQIILASNSLFITDGSDDNMKVLISSSMEKVLDACIITPSISEAASSADNVSTKFHKIQNSGKILVLMIDQQNKNNNYQKSVNVKAFNFLTYQVENNFSLNLPEGQVYRTNNIAKAVITEHGGILLYFHGTVDKNNGTIENHICYTHDFEKHQSFSILKSNLPTISNMFFNTTSNIIFLSNLDYGIEIFDICSRKLVTDYTPGVYNFNSNNGLKIIDQARTILRNPKFNLVNCNLNFLITVDFSMFNSNGLSARKQVFPNTSYLFDVEKTKTGTRTTQPSGQSAVTKPIEIDNYSKNLLYNWLFSLKSNELFMQGLEKLNDLNLLDNEVISAVILKMIENEKELIKNKEVLIKFNYLLERMSLQNLRNLQVDLMSFQWSEGFKIFIF